MKIKTKILNTLTKIETRNKNIKYFYKNKKQKYKIFL